MANCVVCSASNLGISRTPLVLVDGEWFCETCLKKSKGSVVCSNCGNRPFESNEHFKKVNGRYLCTACLEQMGIIKKYDYIAQSLAKGSTRTEQGNNPGATASLGGLRILLDSNLDPGEVIIDAIAGNAGEGMAYSDKHVFVLKSGVATGSLTGRKCKKIDWINVRDFYVKPGPLYCYVEVIEAGARPTEFKDINQAKKSDTAVTYLSGKQPEFEKFISEMRSRIKT